MRASALKSSFPASEFPRNPAAPAGSAIDRADRRLSPVLCRCGPRTGNPASANDAGLGGPRRAPSGQPFLENTMQRRNHVRKRPSRGSLTVVVGGAVGILLATCPLHLVDARHFRIGFAAFL